MTICGSITPEFSCSFSVLNISAKSYHLRGDASDADASAPPLGQCSPASLVVRLLRMLVSPVKVAEHNSLGRHDRISAADPRQRDQRYNSWSRCWNSKSNLTYRVQYRSDLTTNMWTSLRDCVRSTGSMSCITDPIAAGQPQRFYRVAQTNCVP